MSALDKWMIGCNVALVITAIVTIVIAVVAMRRKQPTEVYPQPLYIKLAEQFAHRDEFTAHVRDNDKQRGLIHARIDSLVADYNEKFQALPNQIVALLRNTGSLR